MPDARVDTAWISSAIEAGLDLPAGDSARRQALVDMFVDEGVAPDTYISHWDAYASWLHAAFRGIGVREGSHVLDVGCGAGRGGAASLPLLGPTGCYCGVDSLERYVRMTDRLLSHAWCEVHTLQSASFEFGRMGKSFDFAVAHSLFPHISPEKIEACFEALRGVMRPKGKFLFTFVDHEHVTTYGHLYNGVDLMMRSRAVTADFFEALIRKLDLGVSRDVMQHPTQAVWVVDF